MARADSANRAAEGENVERDQLTSLSCLPGCSALKPEYPFDAANDGFAIAHEAPLSVLAGPLRCTGSAWSSHDRVS